MFLAFRNSFIRVSEFFLLVCLLSRTCRELNGTPFSPFFGCARNSVTKEPFIRLLFFANKQERTTFTAAKVL